MNNDILCSVRIEIHTSVTEHNSTIWNPDTAKSIPAYNKFIDIRRNNIETQLFKKYDLPTSMGNKDSIFNMIMQLDLNEDEKDTFITYINSTDSENGFLIFKNEESRNFAKQIKLANPDWEQYNLEYQPIIPEHLKDKGATAANPLPSQWQKSKGTPSTEGWIANVSLKCSESDKKKCDYDKWKTIGSIKITPAAITGGRKYLNKKRPTKRRRPIKRRRPTKKRKPTKKRRPTKRRR